MQLSEFNEASIRGRKIDSAQTKGSNCPSSLSFVPDNEFVELLWENGQIVMQGKSSRPRKSSAAATSFSLPEDRVDENDGAPISATKMHQIENVNSLVGELSSLDPSSNVRTSAQFDNMVPWVNYPMEDPSSSDYCSDFFSGFPGVVMPAQGNNPVDQNNIKDSNVEHGTVPKAIRDETDPSRVTKMHRSTNAYQSSFVNVTARIENLGTRGGCNAQQGISRNLLGTRSHKQNIASTKLQQVRVSPDSVNLSHLSRPGAPAKVNLQRIDRLKINEDSPSAARSNHIESSVIDSSCGLQSTSIIQGQKGSASAMSELRSSAKKQSDVVDEDMPRKNPNIGITDITKVKLRPPNQNNHHSLDLAAGVALGRLGIEKDNEAIVASSVCSGNTTAVTSDDTKRSTKRKIQEGEESGNHIEDLEDASVKKPISVKSTSAKRTRAAEVHNLSERRRRDRINEKMRALQELIPNCSKVDKASMLEEAIEYLKTLQLQVQMMSMGSGLCIPPKMLPNGMQHIRVPPLGHLPRMGVGMGMDMRFGYGMGMLDMNGSPGCSLIPIPPMHGTRFPSPAVPGQQGLYGMPRPTNLPMFGIPTTGLPMSVPQVLQFNFMPGHSANSNSIPEASIGNTNSLQAPSGAPLSNCKDQREKRLNTVFSQQTNVNDSQVTKESSQQCTSNQTSSGSEDETDD